MGKETSSSGLQPQSESEKLHGDPLKQTLETGKGGTQTQSPGPRQGAKPAPGAETSVEERQDELESAPQERPSDAAGQGTRP